MIKRFILFSLFITIIFKISNLYSQNIKEFMLEQMLKLQFDNKDSLDIYCFSTINSEFYQIKSFLIKEVVSPILNKIDFSKIKSDSLIVDYSFIDYRRHIALQLLITWKEKELWMPPIKFLYTGNNRIKKYKTKLNYENLYYIANHIDPCKNSYRDASPIIVSVFYNLESNKFSHRLYTFLK